MLSPMFTILISMVVTEGRSSLDMVMQHIPRRRGVHTSRAVEYANWCHLALPFSWSFGIGEFWPPLEPFSSRTLRLVSLGYFVLLIIMFTHVQSLAPS